MKKLFNKFISNRTQSKYVICGWPGSGSTMLFQLLKHLNSSVTKLHGMPELNRSTKVFFTIRDPRDILVSAVRRQSQEKLYQKGETYVLKYELERFERIGFKDAYLNALNNSNVTIVKYEYYIPGNEVHLLNLLMDQTGIYLSQEQQKLLLNSCSIEANLKKASSLGNDFKNFDKKTGIHANHISNSGNVGAWKSFFNEEFNEFFNSKYSDFLDELGYF